MTEDLHEGTAVIPGDFEIIAVSDPLALAPGDLVVEARHTPDGSFCCVAVFRRKKGDHE